MSDERPVGKVTITVPYSEQTGGHDGEGTFLSWDGNNGIWVRRDQREIRVRVVDIQLAIERAWPENRTSLLDLLDRVDTEGKSLPSEIREQIAKALDEARQKGWRRS